VNESQGAIGKIANLVSLWNSLEAAVETHTFVTVTLLLLGHVLATRNVEDDDSTCLQQWLPLLHHRTLLEYHALSFLPILRLWGT
jgi:hypothetical protein